MSITTLDGIVAGAQTPRSFLKSAITPRADSTPTVLHSVYGIPPASTVGSASGNLPKTWAITSISKANPAVVTVSGHPWATNDTISIINSNSTPSIDGIRVVTYVGANSFSVPVDTSAGATGNDGSSAGQTSNGGAGLTGYSLTSFSGQIPFTNPTGGKSTYLSRLSGFSHSQNVSLLLCDRLWHNGGISPTLTTIQNFTSSVQIPARDNTGTNTGVGVYAALEIYSALGASSFTPTLTYTNTVGGTSTASLTEAITTSSTAGSFYTFPLAAGDLGVQKAQAITLNSSATSGQMGVVLYRVIERIELPTGTSNSTDVIAGGFSKIYDNSCLFLVIVPSAVAGTRVNGTIFWTQG